MKHWHWKIPKQRVLLANEKTKMLELEPILSWFFLTIQSIIYIFFIWYMIYFPHHQNTSKTLKNNLYIWMLRWIPRPWAFHCFLHRRTPRTAPRRRRRTPKAPPLPSRRLPRLRRRGRLRRRQRRPWRGITHVTWHNWDDGDGRNLCGFWRVFLILILEYFGVASCFFFSIELFFSNSLSKVKVAKSVGAACNVWQS